MNDDSVKAAIRFMWLNYQQDITLDRVAAHAMYSKFYFLRRFKAATGVPPGRFLTTVRLARSKQLLVGEPEMSVTDVAIEVGYDSIGAFSTKFRQVVGMTPSAYRAVHLANPGDVDAARRMGDQGFTSPAASAVRCEGRLVGHVPDEPTVTFIGLFEGVVPQGRPVACAVVSGEGREFDLEAPPGGWNVMAVTLAGAEPGSPGAFGTVVALGSTGELDFALDARPDLVIEMHDNVEYALPVLGAFPEMYAMGQDSALLKAI